MKIDLTEKEYRAIFELALKEWIASSGLARHTTDPEKYLMARSYFKAVTTYLVSKGYTIELTNDKETDKG